MYCVQYRAILYPDISRVYSVIMAELHITEIKLHDICRQILSIYNFQDPHLVITVCVDDSVSCSTYQYDLLLIVYIIYSAEKLLHKSDF